jgi:DNA-binding SARP family transcriptional activator
MEIYNGPFLREEMNEWWAVLTREKLRSKYLRMAGRLGHYWENNGNLDSAIVCFQKSLEIDGLDEECYRRLIACYYRLGERGKALLTYRRCRRVLTSNLGVEPSEETEILRKTIEKSI